MFSNLYKTNEIKTILSSKNRSFFRIFILMTFSYIKILSFENSFLTLKTLNICIDV